MSRGPFDVCTCIFQPSTSKAALSNPSSAHIAYYTVCTAECTYIQCLVGLYDPVKFQFERCCGTSFHSPNLSGLNTETIVGTH